MIEVGEYIRTDKGKIGKVIRMGKFYNGRYDRPHYLIDWNNGRAYFMSQVKNFKHSKDIINLIEVGDIVELINGLNKNEFIRIQYLSELDIIKSHKIISILTHEQYEQNCYKVGDIE